MAATLCVVAVLADIPAGPATADACVSGRGLPPRILETDMGDYNRVEKQDCMNGEWTTFLVYETENERAVIQETIEDPLAFRIDARSFFELKNYDPYAIVDEVRRKADSVGRLPADEIELRLANADAKVQASIARDSQRKNDQCRTRSVLYSGIAVQFGGYWTTPIGFGPPGDSHITYEIDPLVPTAARIAILNAIEQYHFAVISQDSALAYPENIVPRASDDPNPATIVFRVAKTQGAIARTHSFTKATDERSQRRWVTGAIEISPDHFAEFTPEVVGHEIGHVLGIDHLPEGLAGTMQAGSFDPVPWRPELGTIEKDGRAFDECMFLPTERSLL